MSSRVLSSGSYVLVYVALLAFTCLSVGISFLHLAYVWHIVLGLIIGACKCTLVLLIFMHVLYSPRLTWIVILTAVFWLGILLVLTLADYFTRGMIPYTPGH
jgi:cytochrome c oxidase subunit IV